MLDKGQQPFYTDVNVLEIWIWKAKMIKYLLKYRPAHIFDMLKNGNLDPEINTDSFKNRLVVISGTTSGIGYETAVKYASMGADILCINRNEEKSLELCNLLRQRYKTECNFKIADFSSLSDVHKVAEELKSMTRPIDVLIHNAGTYLVKKNFTDDGIETVFQTNYLASFILNFKLKEKFRDQNSGRIIFVNSEGHRFAMAGVHLNDLRWKRHCYNGLKSYGTAKTAQLLAMIKLVEYFKDTNVTVNAMHPGNVRSNMGQNNGEFYKLRKRILVDSSIRPTDIAAEALYYLGVEKKLEKISGKFFNLTKEEIPAPHALDRDAADKVWGKSLELGKLK